MGKGFFMESMVEVITDIEHERVVITARDPGLLCVATFALDTIRENVLLPKSPIRVPVHDKSFFTGLIVKDSSLARLFAVWLG